MAATNKSLTQIDKTLDHRHRYNKRFGSQHRILQGQPSVVSAVLNRVDHVDALLPSRCCERAGSTPIVSATVVFVAIGSKRWDAHCQQQDHRNKHSFHVSIPFSAV